MKARAGLPLLIAAALAAPGWTQPAQQSSMPALAMLQPGLWALKSRMDPSQNRSICVSDPRALLQVQHRTAMCSRFVISNGPRETTVHYTCPGNGHGRTTIRVETARLIQIETQGIANREPFAIQLEGRRTGECNAQVSAIAR